MQLAVSGLPGGERTPSLDAHAARFGARLGALRGDDDGGDGGYKRAAALFREIDVPFWLTVTLAEHGERLAGSSRRDEAEPLLAEADAIFTRLAASPWLERIRGVRQPREGADAI